VELATIILAAGKGKRMKSDLPKVLHPLNGRPMIHYVIDVAESVGSNKIVLIVGHKMELVIESTNNRNIEYVYQEQQLGTGHAVQQAGSHFTDFNGHILILSGDVPLLTAKTLRELIDLHERNKSLASLLTANMEDPTGYGRIIRNKDGFVSKIVEHKDADENDLKIKEINVGIYVFRSEELFNTLPLLNNDNKQKEYYLPDVVKIFVDRGEKVSAQISNDVNETHGINNEKQLKEAEKILLDRL
jgi:UDP-N-acetylglucosamine diphosphorylase/glucosamine-1-phosphate N-acetyltransferase